jgi:hypothetical protein
MSHDNIALSIEGDLADTVELGMRTEEALAEAAANLSDAESRFVKLCRSPLSLPPPRAIWNEAMNPHYS